MLGSQVVHLGPEVAALVLGAVAVWSMCYRYHPCVALGLPVGLAEALDAGGVS